MRGSLTFLLLTFVFGFCYIEVSAQATLEGRVIDGQTNEPLPMVDVILMRGGQQEAIRETNIDGEFRITGLEVGTYAIEFRYIGFQDTTFSDLRLRGGIQREEFQLFEEGIDFEDFVVEVRRRPLIEIDGTTSGSVIDRERLENLPTRSVNQIAALSGGTYAPDGRTPNIRGQRSDGTVYFVDGVRQRGLSGVPQSAIEQVSTQVGGIPARYGDATGGFISITTRGPAEEFTGGVEAITSQFLDPYGYNEIDAHMTGPLLRKEMDDGRERTVLGYFLAGEFGYRGDASPQGFGIHRVTDEWGEELFENPIAQNPEGGGFIPRAELTTMDNVEEVRRRQNAEAMTMSFSGRLDYSITDQMNIRAGGQFSRRDLTAYNYNASLFAPESNPRELRHTYRGYLRFNQRFDIDRSVDRRFDIEDAYYNIQIDYTYQDIEISNPEFGSDIFKYGYLGEYEVYRQPSYTRESREVDGRQIEAFYQDGYQDTLVTFNPSGLNEATSNYTERFFERTRTPTRNLLSIQQQNALLNGQTPPLVYSIWSSPGSFHSYYQTLDESQISANAHGAVTIEGHELGFGLQFEQRFDRNYVVGGFESGAGIWGEMRSLINSHFDGMDTDNPIMVYDEHGVFQDTVRYNRNITNNQSTFDRNFRQSLIDRGATDVYGNPINEETEINIDRYRPEDFSIEMFSASELFRDGSQKLVTYRGYDHHGNRLSGDAANVGFFDEDGNLEFLQSGAIEPYSPIYSAAYLQDKFSFRDLIFNIGLRIDRYDANQMVLADPYSLYPIKTVSQVREEDEDLADQLAGRMGDDFKVYANNTQNPSMITGYRDGNRWYDSGGNEVQDPSQIASGGAIQPFLDGPATLREESFNEFEPVIDLLPRIAFSFPISERSSFSASYDVLTQRPRGRANATIADYYYIENRATRNTNNPALRPEKTINYELGFRQMIGANSALRMQAFYREIRDLVQITEFTGAYPISYRSFENIDFGTVKGFTFGYEFRPMDGNFMMELNYTLQFADGTGSSQTTQAGLVAVGQPNLRTPVPLDFDVRHNIVTNFNYGFGTGARYDGPVTTGGFEILGNTGLNVTLSAVSGEPYSRQSNVNQAVAIGVAQRSSLDGELNSARLPWQFNADARLSRRIPLTFGGREVDAGEGQRARDAGRQYGLNVYLWVENIFDIRNVNNVYRYTGSPEDDGWLTSAEGVQQAQSAASPQAYQDLYTMKAYNPGNFMAPRRVRIGAAFSF